VSSYLTLPSRALFAVALNYRDVERCSAIVGDHQLDVFDFGDIEKELAVKLTDEDVNCALLSIDAVNNLKTLRLTNLLNISGIGLEPLRGSTMIEKIDLSLVGDHESPDLSPAPPISCTEVLPILDSIIDMGGASSLKLLVFPTEWRELEDISTCQDFYDFLDGYQELLCSRVVTCLKCDENLAEDYRMLEMSTDIKHEYATQNVTCYDCMKHYCQNCMEDGVGGLGRAYCMSKLCGICNRRYCFHCSGEWSCGGCDEWFRPDCMDMKQCAQCDENKCINCTSKRKCRNN